MYTTCPKCGKTNPIHSDQLRSAHAMIRCVHCMHRFDPTPHLSDSEPNRPASPAIPRPCENHDAVTVFISYSHDSAAHNQWVKNLAYRLQEAELTVRLDQLDLRPGDNVLHYMQTCATQSDRVIAVCSEIYTTKSDRGEGGAAFEAMILTQDVVNDIYSSKIIPLIRNSSLENPLPIFLTGKKFIDFRNDREFDAQLNELLKCF